MKKWLFYVILFLGLSLVYLNCSSGRNAAVLSPPGQDGSGRWQTEYTTEMLSGTWYVSGTNLSHPAMNSHQAFTLMYELRPDGTFTYKFYFSILFDGLEDEQRSTLMPEDYREFEMTGTWSVSPEGYLQLQYNHMTILFGDSVSLTDCSDDGDDSNDIHATSLRGDLLVHNWQYPQDQSNLIKPYSFSLQNTRIGQCTGGEIDGSEVSVVTHNLYSTNSFVRLGGNRD